MTTLTGKDGEKDSVISVPVTDDESGNSEQDAEDADAEIEADEETEAGGPVEEDASAADEEADKDNV